MANLIVNTLADSGIGSLRQAIMDARAGDTITFTVAGTIQLNSLLTIPVDITIDGTSAPGYAGSPVVTIDGTNAGLSADGLDFTARGSGSTVKGLSIVNFSGAGIDLDGASNVTVQGNFIGADATGAVAAPNGTGIEIQAGATNNTIGGATAGTGNDISGNNGSGIDIDDSDFNSVEGNFIGINAAGTAALGNSNDGVLITGGSTGNIVGGAAAGAGNVISGNIANGVEISGNSDSNTIAGNFVGLDAAGTSALGNGQAGIAITGSDGNTIGGTPAGAGNEIADNAGAGVSIGSGVGDSILANAISQNSIGIDLGAGANDGQSSPILSDVQTSATQIDITGTLDSAANQTYDIEFFASGANLGGNVEGATFLGSASVTTNAFGVATFDSTQSWTIAQGELVTATATNVATGDTSEFSQALTAEGTLTVTNLNDSGAGSLRAALALANAAGGSNTITFASNLAGGTLMLTSGALDITSNVTIEGGTDGVTIDAQGQSRVFDDHHGISTIDGLTITGGNDVGFPGDGGAIQVGSSIAPGGAELTISNSIITDSKAAYGGGGIAVNAGDSLRLTNSTVTGNGAYLIGGGIASQGTLTLTNSTVSNNSAGYIGGGIASDSTLTLINSTLSGNQTGAPGPGFPAGYSYTGGAGLYNSGSATLLDTTITGNASAYAGGGILNTGKLTLMNSIVSGNDALYVGGGILNASELTLTNSTVSGNQITGAGSSPLGQPSAGAGLYNSGAAGLYNATIADNTGAYNGGGIYNSELLTLTNVTLADDSASNGGGLANASCGCGNVAIYDATITGNDASQNGGGIYNANGSVGLANSIVAGNGAGTQGPDVYTALPATTNYAAVNLFSQAGIGGPGGIYVSPSNLSQVFADLTTVDLDGVPNSGDEFHAGTLGNYGGPVQTVLIASGGYAQGAGDVAFLPPDPNDPAEPLSVDARGDLRVVNGTLDLGALELQPLISSPNAVIAAAGTGPIALDIAAPIDSDGSTPTTTLDTVPTYGTTQYFNGTAFVTASGGTMLTPAELASLEYTPPASGEFGGQTITYTATEGLASSQGTIAVTVLAEDTGLSNLYFTAFAGPGNPDLYTLDANGNPVAIPLNVTNGSSAGEDGGFFQFAGNLYFNANGSATSDAEALYELEPNGTVAPVAAGSNGSIDGFFDGDTGVSANFTEFDGSLYFAAETNAGEQLVRLNADGTSQVIVLNAGGQEAFPGQNGGFVEFDGDLYFSAITPSSNFGNPDLIQLDAPGIVTDISAVSGDASSAGEDGGFYVFNNTLYFNAFSTTLGEDTLFALAPGSTTPETVDPSGNVLVTLPVNSATSSAFHEFDGSLYFNEYSVAVGDDTLFKLASDGTLTPLTYFDGTTDEALESAGASGGFVDFAGSTYFVANTQAEGTQFFKLDSAGDITEVTSTPGGAFDFNNLPGNFVVFNDNLYFDAYTGVGLGDGLFQLTAGGALTQIDLGNGPGATTDAGVDGGFQIVGNNLYFSAFTANGYELVGLAANGTVTEFDINPGAGNNSFGTGGSTGNALGVFPENIINGTSGNDILVGSTPDEIINGGSGNDIIEGRGGNDILTGGGGSTDFVFSLAGPSNVDFVTDYSLVQSDLLDVSALVGANFVAGSQIVDFVRLMASGSDLVLQVDPTGSADNPHVWQDVAILENGNVAAVNQVTGFFAGADHTITQTTDFTAPTVQSVVFNAPSIDVGVGALVTVTVNMSEQVLVETANGSPTLGLNDGGVATFDAADSTSTALVFDYTVLASQNTAALSTSAAGVSLNGSTIEDLAANGANLTGSDNVAAAPTIEVDTRKPPTIAGTVADQSTTAEAPVKLFSGVTIADSNAGAADTLTITLSSTNGSFGTLSGTGLTGSGAAYQLAGTAAAITVELDAVSFTPVNGVPGTSVTTTFGLSDQSSAFATATTNDTTSVVDTDLAIPPTPVINFPHVAPSNVDEWILADGQWTTSAQPGSIPAGYQVAGLGDFTGNGTSDILWQNPATGDTQEWLINNGAWAGTVDLGVHPANYQIAGVGDFTGNGIDDVLWTSTSPNGQVQTDIWELSSGGQWQASVSPGSHPSGYNVVGVGDFTGNGTSDILWQNSTSGDVDEWQIANGQWTNSVDLGSHPGSGWTIAGVGDFFGNGRDDILWTNANSGPGGDTEVDIWQLGSNGQWTASVSPGLGLHPPGYQVAAIGNFTGNGIDGVLWYDPANGNVDEWVLNNNGQWATSVDLGTHPGNFQIAGTGSFVNGNSTSDILWHSAS